MAGERLKGFSQSIGVRDPGHADLSGFSRSASFKERTASVLENIGQTAFNIGAERRQREAIEAVESFEFARDADGNISESPDLKDAGPLGMSIFAEHYNSAMTKKIEYEMQSEAEQAAIEIRAKNPNDPVAFQEEYESFLNEKKSLIPDEIRGTVFNRMRGVGQGHFKSMTLEKGINDFNAAAKTSEGAIAKSINDLSIGIYSGKDLASDEALSMTSELYAQVKHHAATFYSEGPAREAYLISQADQIAKAAVMSSASKAIMRAEDGSKITFDDNGVARGEAMVQAALDGTLVVDTYVYDEEIDEFLPVKQPVGAIYNADERKALSNQLNSFVTAGRQLHDAQSNVIMNDMRKDMYALRLQIISDPNVEKKDAGKIAAMKVAEKYKAAGMSDDRIAVLLAQTQENLIDIGRTEQAQAVNTVVAEAQAKILQNDIEVANQYTDTNLDEVVKKSPGAAVDIANGINSTLDQVNRRIKANQKAPTQAQIIVGRFGSYLEAAKGNYHEAAANFHRDTSINRNIENSSKNRKELQEYLFRDVPEGEIINMNPEQIALQALPALEGRVLPEGLHNMFNAVRNIDSPALDDEMIGKMISIANAIEEMPGGKEAIRASLGDANEAFRLIRSSYNQNILDDIQRKHIKDVLLNPKDYTKEALKKNRTAEVIQADRDYIRGRMADVGEWTELNSSITQSVMRDRVEDAFYLFLPIANNDRDQAYDAAWRYVTTGAGAWMRHDGFQGWDRASENPANYVQDAGLNYWVGKGRQGFFNTDASSGITRALFDNKDKLGLDVQHHYQIGFGDKIKIKSTGSATRMNPYEFDVYKQIETENGVLTRRIGRINIKDRITEWSVIAGEKKAMKQRAIKSLFPVTEDMSTLDEFGEF